MPCEIGNGHARCNCHRHYSVLRTATCLVASHDDPGLHVEKRNKEEGSCGAGDQLAMLQNSRSREALSRGAGLLESQQEENLDLMRRQQGGKLGRRMNFVTSINQAAAAMEHFRRYPFTSPTPRRRAAPLGLRCVMQPRGFNLPL
ncbi:hypothetical protein V8C43DRAFT_121882 [Trichoderma afarasin]